ncbi:transcriptional regulator with XRE-family HTH domain [Kibdelosporangium banguiense]|uniref:Transcriptional regulator with XRE-family HTH domain n=1 Tax=Kibdelosporangium banguiense TaxID=1365924 RepID=A0ABS4TDL3_9PSEU|nr:helix-turn-helix transcriptional regulator [Kibdelosporangium banguiense]MBP2321926.1 transcriptional regulator with XRE-family HTH domain [Kibdelosporangium banguiense]
MPRGATPIVQQRRLRTELRKAREEALLTQKTVASDLGWSLSKVIRLETGATSFALSDVMALLHYYKITEPARVDDLLGIARSSGESWWDAYREYYSQKFLNFLAYEDSASAIRQFQTLAIPGLLQTRGYATAVFSGYAYDPQRQQRAIDVRLRRQKLLDDDGLKISIILDQAVILRWVGDAAVMKEQLIRLKTVGETRKGPTSIRIVPFTAGFSMSMKGSFTVFEYDSENNDYIVNAEEPNKDVRVLDTPEATSSYVEAFLNLEDIALSKEESSALIDAAINDLE